MIFFYLNYNFFSLIYGFSFFAYIIPFLGYLIGNAALTVSIIQTFVNSLCGVYQNMLKFNTQKLH